ncbi:FIG01024677: hypothetical protein [hydrothermal vent metagenome]|uniref:VWFA domain-containing protein n=1 Tax=hydrothermal vent metagenome TaxID=652676 RepID=A0A3B0Y5E5_9ZZZZ
MVRYTFKSRVAHLVLMIFCVLSFSASAEKRNNQNVMLIIDASGSMWGKINGEAKIDIARNAISKLVKTWNKQTKIGVMAYGHRRKGDCKDIQTIAPLGKINASQVISILGDLNPKGKTPLSASIKAAATMLKSSEEAATVILVSDGLETCGMDPCLVAKQLKKDNINFRAHVIGFDIKSISDTSKLKCIAENTGGKFITANNTTELNKALDEVKQVAVKKVVVKKVVKKVVVKPIPPKKAIVKTTKINRYAAYKLPSSCKKKRTMFLRTKTKMGGIEECMKIIVTKGGELTIDGIISHSIYIIESGGKVVTKGNQSSVNVFVKAGGELQNVSSWIGRVENDGGKVVNISGDIKRFRMKSGTTIVQEGDIDSAIIDGGYFTMYDGDLKILKVNSGVVKISTAVDVDNQEGAASVELIAPKAKK